MSHVDDVEGWEEDRLSLDGDGDVEGLKLFRLPAQLRSAQRWKRKYLRLKKLLMKHKLKHRRRRRG